MKTITREYKDGTEPDVIARWCCDNLCDQGRDCPAKPAEAATEVGQEEPAFYAHKYILQELFALVWRALAVGGIVVGVAFLAGRFL